MGSAIVVFGNAGGSLVHAFARVGYRVYAGVKDFQEIMSIGFSESCDF